MELLKKYRTNKESSVKIIPTDNCPIVKFSGKWFEKKKSFPIISRLSFVEDANNVFILIRIQEKILIHLGLRTDKQTNEKQRSANRPKEKKAPKPEALVSREAHSISHMKSIKTSQFKYLICFNVVYKIGGLAHTHAHTQVLVHTRHTQ